jgi:hypothetical protein
MAFLEMAFLEMIDLRLIVSDRASCLAPPDLLSACLRQRIQGRLLSSIVTISRLHCLGMKPIPHTTRLRQQAASNASTSSGSSPQRA